MDEWMAEKFGGNVMYVARQSVFLVISISVKENVKQMWTNGQDENELSFAEIKLRMQPEA